MYYTTAIFSLIICISCTNNPVISPKSGSEKIDKIYNPTVPEETTGAKGVKRRRSRSK